MRVNLITLSNTRNRTGRAVMIRPTAVRDGRAVFALGAGSVMAFMVVSPEVECNAGLPDRFDRRKLASTLTSNEPPPDRHRKRISTAAIPNGPVFRFIR